MLSVVGCCGSWIGNPSCYDVVKCGDGDCGYSWVDVKIYHRVEERIIGRFQVYLFII